MRGCPFHKRREKTIATRSRTSFKKRQKEIARMEKQRDKAAQRLVRKQIKLERDPDESPYEIGEPTTAGMDELGNESESETETETENENEKEPIPE